MRVLVVGASGLLGRQIVTRLHAAGHTAVAVARTARDGIDHAVDATTAEVQTWLPLLTGCDGVVFAAGADDREVPARPAYSAFHAGNVVPVVTLLTAARQAGVTRAVVLGSYFTHFNREHPEWDLAGAHPYIRSRVAQAAEGRTAAGPGLPVAVVEVPFVFGRAGERFPAWAEGLVGWVGSKSPLLAPTGGTAVTTAETVADIAVDALEAASGADLPAADGNLTWAEMIGGLAAAAGSPRPVKVLPAAAFRLALRLTALRYRFSRKEPGLHPTRLADLLLRHLHLTATGTRPIDPAMVETVEAVREKR
ncbi:NAD-dependent epimerase/dehydratase family protein [Actinokineospora spheciospongiae]|uniref:NAD-dependent epimerase/dehydratase family protein n=1 Tax=Actinokineospora spheciospongiae TaxID=909613 RepID=UPI000D711231|nr:NAD(P)H-binding protein [Actinokineospora spheciospongiae]